MTTTGKQAGCHSHPQCANGTGKTVFLNDSGMNFDTGVAESCESHVQVGHTMIDSGFSQQSGGGEGVGLDPSD